MRTERNIALLLFVLLGIFTVTNFFDRPIQKAVETPKVAAAEQNTDTKPSNNATATKSYSYIAQPGDSYTVLARKAVQTYGIVNKVNLSQAQIVAAETNLTLSAGSPLLNEGEKVTVDAAKVKSAVEAAQKLSTTEQAEWQVYAADVDFNTNRAGQSS